MEIKDQIEKLNVAFDEFKKTNDARLEEIKKNGKADILTEEKLAKTEKHIASLELKIDQMTAALNRSGQNGGQGEEEGTKEAKAYSEAFKKFMRKGAIPSDEVNEWAKKFMSSDSDVDGGFLITPEVSSEIVKKVYESSPIRELASVITISSNQLDINADLDEAGSGWVGEIQARTETDTPQLNQVIIPVHELYAMPKATQRFLDDAAVNVEAWLADKLSEKFARDEATAFINGSGVNKPKGILAYGSGDGFGLIERVETLANNAIVGDDLINLQTAVKDFYQKNARFLINRKMIGIIRKLKDSVNGAYIWQPSLQAGVPNQLLGSFVNMANDLPAAVTATTDSIIYGDFKAGYQIVDRIGIRTLRDPYTQKGFVLFYTTKRVGGGVKDFEALKVLKVKT